MNHALPAGYSISTDKNLLNIKVIQQYLAEESYWAKNIPKETLQRSIDNSVCFGVYYMSVQVGFARVVTDKATFAYLADVFILETHRGIGLSKQLLETVMEYPDLQGLRRWMLATRDAHGLYTKFGWKQLSHPGRCMEIIYPDIYL